jgi:hypothetical protein
MYIIVSILPAMVEKEVSHYDDGSFSLKVRSHNYDWGVGSFSPACSWLHQTLKFKLNPDAQHKQREFNFT